MGLEGSGPLTRATLLRCRRLPGGALALALAACLPAAPGGGGGGPAGQKPPVKLSLSTDWGTGIRADTVKRWTTEFPRTHASVSEVEVWTSPDQGSTAASYNVKIQAALAGGTGPDVMMEVWPLDPPSILLPLDPYLKQKRFNKADYWWSRYYQETADGRIFSFPLGAYVGAMVANVDLFDRAGVKLPGKDWTFNDLRETARRLKSDRTWGFERGQSDADQGWKNMMASEGAEWYDRQTLKTALATGKDGGKPEEMFDAWWGLVYRDRIAPSPAEIAELGTPLPSPGAGPLFASGFVALSGFRFYQAGLLKAAVGDRFRYQVLWPPKSPYSGRRGFHLETNCISVNKATKAADEAFELGYYWLTDEMSQVTAANLPVMPPGRKWHRSKEVTSVGPGMDIFGDLAAEAQAIGNDRHKWELGTGSSPKGQAWVQAVRPLLERTAMVEGAEPRATFREAIVAGDRALS